MTQNIFGWIEIPVSNMERAIQFYQTVFNIQLHRQQMGDLDMAWFPWIEGGAPGAGGALAYQKDMYQPSQQGTLAYLMSQEDNLNVELARIEAAGGKVLMPKTPIGDDAAFGYMALFNDTEGNRVALHSKN